MRSLPLAFAVLVSMAPAAWAQDQSAATSPLPSATPGAADQAAAQALFDNARKAMDAGDYAHACPMFESSQKLDPQPGTQFNLAACYDKGGRAASAWITYQEAASASAAAGRPEWAQKAKEKAAGIEARVAKLTIAPVASYAGFEVHRDGVLVQPGAYNVQLPVDAGEHVIEAIAPQKNKWRLKVKLLEGKALQVKIPPLTDQADTSAVAEGDDDSVPPPLPGAPASPPSNGSTQRIVGYSLFAIAGASVIVGSVLGLMAKSKQSDASPLCRTDTTCTSAGAGFIGSAQTLAAGSTVMFVVGGVAALEGLTLLLTAPKSATSPTLQKQGVRVDLGAPQSLAGLSLRGAW